MSLTNRKPRPLTRNESTFRDDRLFLVACDDTYAPKQYFDFFEFTRVKIFVIPTIDGTSHARQVLNRLSEFECEENDQRWMLLDTDHCIRNNHKSAFISAIQEAKGNGINVAVSRSCFEVWLLLHHVEESYVSALGNAAEVENALREKVGEYNKVNLKMEHYPLSSVLDACRRAEKLDKSVGGGDIPESTTTRVYLLWKAIISKALRSQLPNELRQLVE
jgi:hypothetical protein